MYFQVLSAGCCRALLGTRERQGLGTADTAALVLRSAGRLWGCVRGTGHLPQAVTCP